MSTKKYRFRLLAGSHKEDGVSYDATQRDGKKPVVESDRELDIKFRNKFQRLPAKGSATEAPYESLEEDDMVLVRAAKDKPALDFQEDDDETIAERKKVKKTMLPGADTNLDYEKDIEDDPITSPSVDAAVKKVVTKKKKSRRTKPSGAAVKKKPATKKKATAKKPTAKKGNEILPVERGEEMFDVVLFKNGKETNTMYNSDFLNKKQATALAKKMSKTKAPKK